MISHARRRQRPGAALRWTIAALVALAAHGLFAVFVAVTGFGDFLGKVAPPPETKLNPVALRAVPKSAWEQNRRAASKASSSPLAAAQPPKPKVEKKKEPEEKPEGRVVDVAPGNGEKPDDAKFLAETNNRVEKETISRHRTLNYFNAAPRPTTTVKENETAKGRDAVEKPVLAGNEGTGDDPREPSEGKGKAMLEIPSTKRRDRLALKLDGLGGNLMNQEAQDEIIGNSHRLRIQVGGEDGGELAGSLGKAGTRELRTRMPAAAGLDP
ncbi:MAG: energy transducer TonB, partial [Myxococcales bacterium]